LIIGIPHCIDFAYSCDWIHPVHTNDVVYPAR